MERFFSVFGIVMMVVLPIGIACFVFHDLAHPELWSDWTHNPKIYGPLGLIVMVPVLLIWAYTAWQAWLAQRRYDRMVAQRKMNQR